MRKQIYQKTNARQEIIDYYHIDPESERTVVVLDNQDIADLIHDNIRDISRRTFEDILDYGHDEWFIDAHDIDLYNALDFNTENQIRKYVKEVLGVAVEEYEDEEIFEIFLKDDIDHLVYSLYDEAWWIGSGNRVIEELKDSLKEATDLLEADDDLSIRELKAWYEMSPNHDNQVIGSFNTEALINLLVTDEDDVYDHSSLEQVALHILNDNFMITEPYNGFEEFDSNYYNNEIQNYVAQQIALKQTKLD